MWLQPLFFSIRAKQPMQNRTSVCVTHSLNAFCSSSVPVLVRSSCSARAASRCTSRMLATKLLYFGRGTTCLTWLSASCFLQPSAGHRTYSFPSVICPSAQVDRQVEQHSRGWQLIEVRPSELQSNGS